MRSISTILATLISIIALLMVTAAISSYMLSMFTSAGKISHIAHEKLVDYMEITDKLVVNSTDSLICFKDYSGRAKMIVIRNQNGIETYEFKSKICLDKSLLNTINSMYIVSKHGAIIPIPSYAISNLKSFEGNASLASLLNPLGTQNNPGINNYYYEVRIDQPDFSKEGDDIIHLKVTSTSYTFEFYGKWIIYYNVNGELSTTTLSESFSTTGAFNNITVVKLGDVICLTGLFNYSGDQEFNTEGFAVTCYKRVVVTGHVRIEATLVNLHDPIIEDFVKNVIEKGTAMIKLGFSDAKIWLRITQPRPSSLDSQIVVFTRDAYNNLWFLTTPTIDDGMLTKEVYALNFYNILGEGLLTPLLDFMDAAGYQLIPKVNLGEIPETAVATPGFITYVDIGGATCRLIRANAIASKPFINLGYGLYLIPGLICLHSYEGKARIVLKLSPYDKVDALEAPYEVITCYYPYILECDGTVEFYYSFAPKLLFEHPYEIATILSSAGSWFRSNYFDIESVPYPKIWFNDRLVDRVSEASQTLAQFCNLRVLIAPLGSRPTLIKPSSTCKNLLPGVGSFIFLGYVLSLPSIYNQLPDAFQVGIPLSIPPGFEVR